MTDKKNKKLAARQKMFEKYQEAKLVRKIVMMISVIVLVLLILIVGGGYFYIILKDLSVFNDPASFETLANACYR